MGGEGLTVRAVLATLRHTLLCDDRCDVTVRCHIKGRVLNARAFGGDLRSTNVRHLARRAALNGDLAALAEREVNGARRRTSIASRFGMRRTSVW